MERWLGRWSEIAFTLLRVVAGLMFALHGAQKFGLLGGAAMTGTPKMLVAAVVELVGGLLIAAGFLTGFAAFVASGQMAVAYWTVHAPGGWSPLANKGELAVLYCFLFLYVATRGGGRYSLDHAIFRKR